MMVPGEGVPLTNLPLVAPDRGQADSAPEHRAGRAGLPASAGF
jgi:hypothetical protein